MASRTINTQCLYIAHNGEGTFFAEKPKLLLMDSETPMKTLFGSDHIMIAKLPDSNCINITLFEDNIDLGFSTANELAIYLKATSYMYLSICGFTPAPYFEGIHAKPIINFKIQDASFSDALEDSISLPYINNSCDLELEIVNFLETYFVPKSLSDKLFAPQKIDLSLREGGYTAFSTFLQKYGLNISDFVPPINPWFFLKPVTRTILLKYADVTVI
jgi:hypothetical protein